MDNQTLPPVPISGINKSIIQGVVGIIVCLFNFVLIAAILFSKSTRQNKEFIIISGKMFADGFYAFAYIIYASYNIFHYLDGSYLTFYSRVYCLLAQPYNTMFVINVPLCGLAITMVSFDRFLAIAKPEKYYILGLKYAWGMNIGIFLFCVTLLLINTIVVIADPEPTTSPSCGISSALHPVFWPYWRMARITGTVVGIALYVPIIFMLLKRRKLWNSINNNKMLNVTITIGMTTISEFCLLLVPDIIISFNLNDNFSSTGFFIIQAKGVVNFFIYTLRHKELRRALLSLIKSKTNQISSNALNVAPVIRLSIQNQRKASSPN